MKAQTNLFHPNTSFTFYDNFLQIRVSLCISKNIMKELMNKGFASNICSGKHRTVFFMTYATKDYSKENIIKIQKFLLNEIMLRIRFAKFLLLLDERIGLKQKSVELSKQLKNE